MKLIASLILAAELTALLAGRCAERRADASTSRVAAVRTVDVQRDVRTSGKIVPEVGSEVKIGPRISGRLVKLHVRVGDTVRKGALVAEIDRGTLATTLSSARAGLEEAQADEQYQRSAFDRVSSLYHSGLASKELVDLSRRDLARAAAHRKASEAAVLAANVELTYTSVYSPITGVVASVSTQEGETVAASFAAPTFVTIVDVNRLKLIAYLDEYDVSRVKPGLPVTFTVEALPSAEFAGRVSSLNPQAVTRDNVTTYIANIDIAPTQGHDLRPDMSATIVIATGQRLRITVVPQAAVRREGEMTYVLVRKSNGFERRRIVLGERIGNDIHVREGLTAGEEVAVSSEAHE